MPSDPALVSYVRTALASGANLKQIREALKGQDWPDSTIDASFTEATRPRAGAPLLRLGGPTAPPSSPTSPYGSPGIPAGYQPGAPLGAQQYGQPYTGPPPEGTLSVGSRIGFAVAFAGGAAGLARVLLGTALGMPPALTNTLAGAAAPLTALFAVLIVLAATIMKKGKFIPGAAVAIALSVVLLIFAADITLQAPALLGLAGGILGFLKK